MKEKEVKVDCEEQQVVLFAEKDDHSYGPVQTGSYITRNFLEDFQLKQQHLEDNLLKRMLAGEISPLYFYMTLEDISISELAKRAGIRKSKVKKHLDPVHFKKATVAELKLYADVFNIPIANLFQVIHTIQDGNWKSHFREASGGSAQGLVQHTTNNPVIVITTTTEKS